MSKDANDVLRDQGPEALREKVEHSKIVQLDLPKRPQPVLEIGSDAEVARHAKHAIVEEFGELVGANGKLFCWTGKFWRELRPSDFYPHIEALDGEHIEDYRIRLSASRVKSVETLLYRQNEKPEFFENRATGIPCENGFVLVSRSGAILAPHDPNNRNRYFLPIEWDEQELFLPPEGSLLETLIDGCFKRDPEAGLKSEILRELAGAALVGTRSLRTSAKAIVLLGEKAANGKSQVLEMLRHLLPSDRQVSITPAQFSDERMLVHLDGKRLNAADEIGGKAIASERFKAVITGEPVTARDVYRTAVTFSSRCLHVFSTNSLPSFEGGMGHGVRRRLFVMRFDRVIPEDERIPDLGKRIAEEEAEILLSWAIGGAIELARAGRFCPLPSSDSILQDWVRMSDPIAEWLADDEATLVTGNEADREAMSVAHKDFADWCKRMKLPPSKIPSMIIFSKQINAGDYSGLARVRTKNGKFVCGLKILGAGGVPRMC